jgi:hypothetical protein
VFLKCLSENRELLPDVELLLEATQKVHPTNRTPVHILLLLLMLVSSVSKRPTPALSQQMLDMAVLYFQQFQVKTLFSVRKTRSGIIFTLMPLANIISAFS